MLLSVGCAVALALSAAGALRPGAPLRAKIDTWRQARATRQVLKRDWPSLTASPDRLGAAVAATQVVVFLDFQCPFCARAWPMLDSALTSHPDMGIAVRQLPLPMHPAAPEAARAAVCAEGEAKFPQMARQLFTDRRWQQDHNWLRQARAAGLSDAVRFRACLHSPETDRRLAQDSVFAHELGIHGTPTFVLADRVIPGLLRPEELSRLALGPHASLEVKEPHGRGLDARTPDTRRGQ